MAPAGSIPSEAGSVAWVNRAGLAFLEDLIWKCVSLTSVGKESYAPILEGMLTDHYVERRLFRRFRVYLPLKNPAHSTPEEEEDAAELACEALRDNPRASLGDAAAFMGLREAAMMDVWAPLRDAFRDPVAFPRQPAAIHLRVSFMRVWRPFALKVSLHHGSGARIVPNDEANGSAGIGVALLSLASHPINQLLLSWRAVLLKRAARTRSMPAFGLAPGGTPPTVSAKQHHVIS